MTMSGLPLPLRHILLTAALFTSTSMAMPAHQIFARASTCPADQVSCPSSNPTNFCCSSGTVCQSLAGGTTALCCPTGRDCSKIQPIPCDVSVQDPEKHPEAAIKTNVFNIPLGKCGTTACCPFGYTCNNDSECLKDSDQDTVPSATASVVPSGTATPTGTATGTATHSPTGTGTAEPSTTAALPTVAAPSGTLPANSTEPAEEKKHNSGPATTSIIGGVVGSALVLLCIGLIVFLYIRRKNRRDANNEKGGFYGSGRTNSSTTSSFGNVISDPIMQPNSFRTDFILKTPSSQASSGLRTMSSGASTAAGPRRFSMSPKNPPRIRISIPNPFESPSPSPNVTTSRLSSPDNRPPRTGNVAARLPPIRAMKNSIRYSRHPAIQDLQREPSTESISVFADPNSMNPKPKTRRLTTFTDLMDEADLGEVRRGSPYVPERPYVPGTTPRI